MPSNEQIAIVFCDQAYAGFSGASDSIGISVEDRRILAIGIIQIAGQFDSVRMTIMSRRAFSAFTQQVTDLLQ